jgi:hypothetical protein
MTVGPRRLPDCRRALDESQYRQLLPKSYTNPQQQQIDDLQRLSKEYEKQAALRMSSRSPSNGNREPYINEPIPVGPGRRNAPEYSSRRHAGR